LRQVSSVALSTLMLSALIGGCSADSTDGSQLDRGNATPLALPEPRVLSPLPATSLTVLPSVNDVLVAVPEGRNDPYAPFPKRTSGPELGDTGERDWKVLGVLSVANQLRALISTTEKSGLVCLGAGGRCPGEAQQLLPMDLEVQAINIRTGCLTVLQSGQSQRVCIT
jgi:Tfp pilus assembly protein PilP